MSGLVLILVGLLLAVAGGRSLRLAVCGMGFGVSWLVADALGSSTATALLVAVAGAAVALLMTLLMTRILLFVVGAVAGATIGAKVFVLLDGPDVSFALGALFVPAFALSFGFLASRFRVTFVRWVTAFGGAALILSGLGLLLPGVLDDLRIPDDAAGRVFMTVAWVGLGLVGASIQRVSKKDDASKNA